MLFQQVITCACSSFHVLKPVQGLVKMLKIILNNKIKFETCKNNLKNTFDLILKFWYVIMQNK